jgi:hypothetical protein
MGDRIHSAILVTDLETGHSATVLLNKMSLKEINPSSRNTNPMKAIIIPACLSLVATLSTLCNAQASPVQHRSTRSSWPTKAVTPTRQSASTVKPNSQTEAMPKPQSSQVQPASHDPRRSLQQPCPGCGMG